jgi:hypothetical protein
MELKEEYSAIFFWSFPKLEIVIQVNSIEIWFVFLNQIYFQRKDVCYSGIARSTNQKRNKKI